jgi:uncharacterized HAD superfamily protein/hypoxanthine phosphoribosyltransferase
MFGFLSFGNLSAKISEGIDRIPLGIEMVVGIPRSGMIPAYMIGLYRNISVLDLPSFLSDKTAEQGLRKFGSERKSAMQASWILLVDDSISTGRAMREAVDKIKASGYTGKVTTCAAVAEPSRHHYVDIHFCEMPNPRLFEWNAFHRPGIVEEACFDLDGVLCVDPTDDENDDGARYVEFLQHARPRFRPTLKIGDIVSARLEKYRGLTEKWLLDNNIQYRRLHLLDLPSARDRMRLNAYCPHKAKVYSESGASIFFESDPSQAGEIARLTSKPVLCTDEMRMYLPGLRLRSAPQIIRWRLGKPIGRVRAKMRSLFDVFGMDLDAFISRGVRARRRFTKRIRAGV